MWRVEKPSLQETEPCNWNAIPPNIKYQCTARCPHKIPLPLSWQFPYNRSDGTSNFSILGLRMRCICGFHHPAFVGTTNVTAVHRRPRKKRKKRTGCSGKLWHFMGMGAWPLALNFFWTWELQILDHCFRTAFINWVQWLWPAAAACVDCLIPSELGFSKTWVDKWWNWWNSTCRPLKIQWCFLLQDAWMMNSDRKGRGWLGGGSNCGPGRSPLWRWGSEVVVSVSPFVGENAMKTWTFLSFWNAGRNLIHSWYCIYI